MRKIGSVLVAVAGVLAVAAPTQAAAPAVGSFRSVLAQGEGQTATATDLGAFEAGGTVPDAFTSQTPLYAGIMPRAKTLTASDLDTFYKDTDFGSLPGGAGTTTTPRPGVTIVRDARFGMAHVTGATRSDVMFGAGYATAQERLFLMDVLRHMAKGTMAALTGAGSAPDDSSQLGDQDFSDDELSAQFDALPVKYGADGAQAHQDLLDYIAGINADISEVTSNPLELPAEYPALGITPAPWTVSDTAAVAVLLVTQFTVSNGGEQINAAMQQAFQKRFGKRWRKPYDDLREANDPAAFTVAKRAFPSDDTGKPRTGGNLIPDAGSVQKRNAIVSGPGAAQSASARAALPAWAQSVAGLKAALPHVESNAVMVSGRLSSTGKPIAAMGPQVGYYSPQIFVEMELHGGGIDESGVSFPGASPYALIGHGLDFAWSGTSANGDNADTFVEKLCNADGSPATRSSQSYMYKGTCTPFVARDQAVTTPVAPTSPDQPRTITYRALRSVHGPVFATATVGGAPVALTVAKAVDFHELSAVIPFMQLAENVPTDAASFQKVMGTFPGTENWFYTDDRKVAFIQSGVYPRHAKGSDVDLPFNGDGSGDWRGFDPVAYTSQYLPGSARPQALEPKDGYIISWNNKEGIGWRKGPTEWSGGTVHRALMLQRHLLTEVKHGGGKVDLAGLARAVSETATTDLRGEEDYPWMRRAIGTASGREEQLLQLLDTWHAAGAQRVDTDGDNIDEYSGANALMGAWWPLAVKAEFGPVLGDTLYETLRKNVLNPDNPDYGGGGWYSQVQKDLRDLLRRRVLGRYSRIYCGGGVRARCRAALLASLDAADAVVTKAQGTGDPSKWVLHATCPKTTPPSCDQIVPTTAGAIDTPPFPWQNRGTFHQLDAITGQR